jgi:molecular chaperone GrpE
MQYSNIQERMSNQRQSGDTQAIVTVVRAVLELLDNFDRAYGVIKPSSEAEQAIEAEYKLAYQQILDTFAKLGVREVDTVGKEFDYEFHQAIMQMPGTDFEEGIVCQEFQKGFLMGQESSSGDDGEDGEDSGPSLTLIRPAMVAVAA